MRRIALGLALAVAIGCGDDEEIDAGPGGPAPAAEFRSARVDAMLEAASRVARTRGFSSEGEQGGPVWGEWRGFLVEQGSDVRPFAMHTGSCYVVVGVASSALRELDLRVFGADGTEVARDAESGSVAVVRLCPAQNGSYYVAARASAGSGLFAVRGFRGPTGLAFRVEAVLRAVAPISEREPE
jgi:hypothetical protein